MASIRPLTVDHSFMVHTLDLSCTEFPTDFSLRANQLYWAPRVAARTYSMVIAYVPLSTWGQRLEVELCTALLQTLGVPATSVGVTLAS